MLFNLTGTNFKSAGKASGVLKELAGSQYETSTYRYPEDLGAGDKAHYIIININRFKCYLLTLRGIHACKC